jgi:hypothetical protein
VSFFEPENPKVTKPVAYCHFVVGKLDDAAGLYRQIIASGNASPYDLMNAGHVQLCLGHWEESFNLYRQCIKGKSMTQETFRNAFEEDVQYLIRNGVRPEDIPLLTDALLFQFDEN